MIITYAEIDGFKNLSGISFAPHYKYNIITGRNAQGKTNLLEAMWILSGCRSFRGSKEKDYITIGGSRMSSEVKIHDGAREQKISIKMARNASVPKQITLNGVKQKGTRSLFDVFKCIAFIPDDVEIIKGSPEKRRNFIDMAASQLNPVFVVHINKHNAAMNQRNALLKEIGIMAENGKIKNDMIRKYNQIDHFVELIADHLKKLDGKDTNLNEIYDCISSFPMMSDYTCTLVKDFTLKSIEKLETYYFDLDKRIVLNEYNAISNYLENGYKFTLNDNHELRIYKNDELISKHNNIEYYIGGYYFSGTNGIIYKLEFKNESNN